MGCSSSKDADQPKKTIIIQQQEPVQHIIPIDNSSVINEKRRVQIEEEDRYRKDAIERAEAKKREATLKTPPRSNKEKHSKVLAHVDDKYKNLQANFILLNENLRKNDKEEKTLPIINQTIKNDGRDIENSLEDLQSQSFPNDKEYSKELKKAVRVSKNLDLEYQGLKKNTKKYPEYKKNVLGLLHDQYPDLFDESRTQEESMRRSVSPPRPEIRNISTRIDPPPRNVGERPIMFRDDPLVRVGDSLPPQPIIAATFDDPFDREMAAVMEKQRDDTAFELEAAVKEFERLKMDVNVLKTRQDNLQKDYRATQQEIKELQNANRQIQNLNGTIGKENGSFNENKTEVLRKHEHTKQACAALEKELAELRALYVQRVAESDLMDQEHQLRVTQMEYEIKRKQDDAREIDMSRKEEDVRLREDERRYQDDERRREELERRRIDIERKRQDDERRRVEADRIHKEEVRRVEAKIQEVDRMRRNLALEPVVPIVSDFSVSVPIVRDVRSSVHVSPVKTMPVVLPPIVDGREIEMRLQEDVRRIKMMNEEADVRRAHMMHQLNQPVIIETSAPVPVQYSAPVGFNDIMLPNKYSNMSVENLNPVVVLEPHTHNFVNHETIVPIVGEGRRSIHVEHPKVEVANSALEMARRARMGNDRHQLAAVMDHTRLEAQNVPIAYQSGFGY